MNTSPHVWAYALHTSARNGFSRTPEHVSDALAGPPWTDTRGRGIWALTGDSGAPALEESSSDA